MSSLSKDFLRQETQNKTIWVTIQWKMNIFLRENLFPFETKCQSECLFIWLTYFNSNPMLPEEWAKADVVNQFGSNPKIVSLEAFHSILMYIKRVKGIKINVFQCEKFINSLLFPIFNIHLYQQFIVEAGTKAWTWSRRDIDRSWGSLVHLYLDPLIFKV